MKRRLTVVAAALAATIALSVLGYFILSGKQPQRLTPMTDAPGVYRTAVQAMTNADHMALSVSKTQETTVQTHTFSETSRQSLSYQGLGTDAFCASLDETFIIDSHSVRIQEAYAEGTAYAALDGGYFSTAMAPEEYLTRFTPAVLMDPQLYGSITGVDDGTSYIITFAQPTAPESWALTGDCTLLDATGTAYVSYDNRLIKSVYSVTYSQADVTYRQNIIVEIASFSGSIAGPEHGDQYTSIAYFDGPRTLERSTGYLLEAQQVRSVYRESAYFEAFGDKRLKEISLYTHRDDTWSARVDTNETFTNDSRIDQATTQSKREIFANGQYSLSKNGGAAATDPAVSKDHMFRYCRNLLVGTVMLPQYIAGAQLSQEDGAVRITFTANEAFAQLVSSNTCQALYKDPEMLSTLTQTNTTDELVCYLDLDNTGLPIASGISYSGTYKIEGLSYQLDFQADQTFDLTGQGVLEIIHASD